MQWEVVIGLEIHAQLATKSKIFSGASTAYGAAPNTQACAVDLGLPGVLPVLNKEAVRMAVPTIVRSRAALSSPAKTIFTPICPKAIRSVSLSCPLWPRAIWRLSWKMAQAKRLESPVPIWKKMPVNPYMRIFTA